MSEPPSLRAPLGIPISRSIQVPAGRTFDPVRRALDAIDAVHGDGVLPLLPVVRTRATTTTGSYEWSDRTGEPLRLCLSSLGERSELTIVHEIGHFLDHQALGRPGVFASESDAMTPVMEAIHQSLAIRTLVRLRGRRIVLLQVRGRREKEPIDRDRVEYYLTPREQFARAYAQYIALASRSSLLRAQVEMTRRTRLATVYHPQWEDDDFESILRQLERLFRRMRWMTS